MAKAVITEAYLEDIADAIREKLNTQSTYKPSEMAEAISSIIGGSINLETKTKSYTPTENIQTETITASSGYDGLREVDVTVGAVSSTYVGSEISRNSSTNLTASGPTITAPAGYYENDATKSIANGTEGTPTATKGTVSNHAISVTPSVTNVAGYISGGTHTGTAVSVSASEVTSGNKEITSNGTNIDVVNYATVSVNVSGGGGGSSVTQDQDGYIVLPATEGGGGSGGSSNFVQGNFTTSETAGSVQTINIPYTGNGYPITLMIYPSTGMAGGAVGSLIQQYAVISYWMVKSYISEDPTYSDTSTPNHAYVLARYKNTSSSSTSHATSSGNPAYVYSTSNPTNTGVNCVKFSDDTTLKIFIASGSYGFPANKDFTYQVVYSE